MNQKQLNKLVQDKLATTEADIVIVHFDPEYQVIQIDIQWEGYADFKTEAEMQVAVEERAIAGAITFMDTHSGESMVAYGFVWNKE